MLSTTAHRLLTEVGSTLPDRLLDELVRAVRFAGGLGTVGGGQVSPVSDARPEPRNDIIEPPVGEDVAAPTAAVTATPGREETPGFLPTEPARLGVESVAVRLIATAGIIGIGTALGAILRANNVVGWIVGLVVSVVSVILAAILWRSRRL